MLAATVHNECEAWPEADGRGNPLTLPQGAWTIIGAEPAQWQSARGEAEEGKIRPRFKARWAIRVGSGRGATALHLHDSDHEDSVGKRSEIRGYAGEGARESRHAAGRWAETIYQAGIRRAQSVVRDGLFRRRNSQPNGERW